MVDLIPGTSLPIAGPSAAQQPEGRGDVVLTRERSHPPSLVMAPEEVAGYLDAAAKLHAEAAVRAIDRSPHRERTVSSSSSGVTDASTGNLLIQLYVVPAGMEGHLSSLLVDTPRSATITPSAPFSDAGAFMFAAILGPSSTDNDGGALAARPGMVAFAPASAAGPFLPGQWTFTDSDAPVGFGGDAFYLSLVGGSVAALLALTIRARFRVNLYSHA